MSVIVPVIGGMPQLNGEGFALFPSRWDCEYFEERPLLIDLDYLRTSGWPAVPALLTQQRALMIGQAQHVLETLASSPYLAERDPVSLGVSWQGYHYEIPSARFGGLEMGITLIGAQISLKTSDSLDTYGIMPCDILPGFVITQQQSPAKVMENILNGSKYVN